MLDETYHLQKKIAKGEHSTVKLVQDRQGKFYSAKLMYYSSEQSKQLAISLISNEIKILQGLSNSSSIQLVASSLEAKVLKKGKTKACVYLISNYCRLGTLYHLSKLSPSESTARHFFLNLISAVESIHLQGVRHLNLRMENILIDTNLNIKLGGFSMSSASGAMKKVKHGIYSAPEVLKCKKYVDKNVDLFALGVILFMLVCRSPPFYRASFTDSHYKLLQAKPAAFWNMFPRVSDEFKELIEGITKEDPSQRLDIHSIKVSRWVKGDTNLEELEIIRRKLCAFN
jgi:serine/threonine protein kinase